MNKFAKVVDVDGGQVLIYSEDQDEEGNDAFCITLKTKLNKGFVSSRLTFINEEDREKAMERVFDDEEVVVGMAEDFFNDMKTAYDALENGDAQTFLEKTATIVSEEEDEQD